MGIIYGHSFRSVYIHILAIVHPSSAKLQVFSKNEIKENMRSSKFWLPLSLALT